MNFPYRMLKFFLRLIIKREYLACWLRFRLYFWLACFFPLKITCARHIKLHNGTTCSLKFWTVYLVAACAEFFKFVNGSKTNHLFVSENILRQQSSIPSFTFMFANFVGDAMQEISNSFPTTSCLLLDNYLRNIDKSFHIYPIQVIPNWGYYKKLPDLSLAALSSGKAQKFLIWRF